MRSQGKIIWEAAEGLVALRRVARSEFLYLEAASAVLAEHLAGVFVERAQREHVSLTPKEAHELRKEVEQTVPLIHFDPQSEVLRRLVLVILWLKDPAIFNAVVVELDDEIEQGTYTTVDVVRRATWRVEKRICREQNRSIASLDEQIERYGCDDFGIMLFEFEDELWHEVRKLDFGLRYLGYILNKLTLHQICQLEGCSYRQARKRRLQVLEAIIRSLG